MKIDVVFSGGGVKAYAFIGALKAIYEKNLQIERVAGTSAGAIFSSLVAARYTFDEITALVNELDLKQLLDKPLVSKVLPFSKWLVLYFQLGLYKGDHLEQWLYSQLSKKGIYTFADLQDGQFKVVVSDLTLGKLVVIPNDLRRVYGIDEKDFPVARAVRMSAGFPYFFIPKKLISDSNQKSIIVDGGLLSNFPLWIFEDGSETKKRPVLGVKLGESMDSMKRKNIRNSFDMFQAMFLTMKKAHDNRYISKEEKRNIIYIPVNDIDSIDFNIEDELKLQMSEKGYERSTEFLQRWPK